ncbi:Molybdopterin synthase sulfur carrier subunit [Plasmodiophora brassicae]|nr:hypothetical protein PBRA_007158 [Plasmodiophora brassicae]
MGRGVVRYTLGEKIAIAREAYDEPGKVYRTSQKYGVDYRQIKRWRTLLDKEDVRHGAKVYRPASSIRQRTGLAGMPTAYRLLVFGMARDLVGGAPAIEINVTPPVTLDGLIAKVYAEYPQLRQLSDYMMLAVNLEYRDLADQRPLSPDDEVALIPPIGGG